MTKKDWLEIFSTLGDKDFFDILTIIASVVSPFLLLISIIISYKSAKVSEQSVKLNKEMYLVQKRERDESFLPIFMIDNFSLGPERNYITFDLVNKNDKDIVPRHAGSESPAEIYDWKKSDHVIKFTVYDDYHNKDHLKLWLYYTTLNHKEINSKLVLRIIDGDLVIQE
ncbi:hypothetical protein [Lentibacillus salicampi]|uniref:Uncharacterized protein n=1 Tax=Lentibacillus salicampi TaxID=175306 RepID=A0A4Y9AE88_9BACI|nr:hypothetical protein [Lentibacillus salicampi]TFJ92714.1 hypothetical protein E4U82_10530 [Lentibacillus salicampi]